MAVDMFMKIKGTKSGNIKGESCDTDPDLVDSIEVLKWSWGMSAPFDVATGQRSGRRQIQPFTFTKYIDKSSPLLETALTTNEEIVSAILTCRRAGIAGADPVKFLIITFEKAAVARIARSVDHDEEKLTEEITLVFGKYNECYTEITSDGGKGDRNQSADDWTQGAN
jgi:type VI secretion system secreted protein Hcp